MAQLAVPNDNFTNSIRLEGTNITVAGNGANATLENSGSDLLGQDRLVFLGGAVHEPCKLHDVPTYAGGVRFGFYRAHT